MEQLTWKQAVEQARVLVVQKRTNQMKIAALALEVCEITHGGHYKSRGYTMAKFAQEVKLNYKTLSNWIFIYKSVYVKAPYKLRDQASFVKLQSVARRITKDTKSSDIPKMLLDEMSRNKIDSLMVDYIRNFRSLVACLNKPNIWDCDIKTLEEARWYVVQADLRFKEMAKLKPIAVMNHGILSTRGQSASSALAAFRTDAQYAAGEFGNKIKISEVDKQVYAFMKMHRKKSFGPTDLGSIFKEGNDNTRKLKALRALQKLLDLDLVKKDEQGKYAIAA